MKAGRRRVLGLCGVAAAMAGSVAGAPMLTGADPLRSSDFSFLNASEGGGLDHNLAHQRATPEARREAAAAAARCEQPGWRADHPALCPAEPPTAGEARLAAAAGREAGVAGTTQPDGLWGPLIPGFETTAIHAVVMPTGKVLYFSQPKEGPADEVEGVNGGNAHVWDPVARTTKAVPPPVVDYDGIGNPRPANLWCAGQTLLPDGRVLVVGGNLEYPLNNGNGAGNGFKGGRWVMTFDPWTETWTRYADMAEGRWYPTLTELPDGRVLIVGGWDQSGGVDNGGPGVPPQMINAQTVEIFDPARATAPGADATVDLSRLPPNGPGQPQPYPDHRYLGLYPHMFVLPGDTALGAGGDKVLVAGPGEYDSAVIDTTDGIWTDVGDAQPPNYELMSQTRSWGTAWLEPSGTGGARRVVLLSGVDTDNAAPGGGDAPDPTPTAEVLDLDDPAAGWVVGAAPALNTGRGHFNTVLLPDGSLFTNGGGLGRKAGSMYAGPIYGAELLRPGATQWDAIGSEFDARTYHSTSVLLPDGSVVSAGDDRDTADALHPAHTYGGTDGGHHALADRTAQVYSPPYLFAGPRPTVTFSPGRVRYSAPFRVAVQGAPSAITGAVLMRPGAVTHAVDMSQQMIRLPLTVQADGLTMTAPRDATVAPPGYYMLFLQNADGAVSQAAWIRLDASAPDAPALPVAPAPPAVPAPAPAPPATPITPADRRAPALRVPSLRATVRGRAVIVRVRLRVDERGTLRTGVARVGRGSRVVLSRRSRRPVTLLAARTRTFRIDARLAGRAVPRRVRITLRVRDRAGNARRVVRTVTLRRIGVPRP